MNNVLFINGDIIPAQQPVVTADNRGLRYGDGLFETIKVIHGNIPLMPLHMERLLNGLSTLQIPLPSFYTTTYLSDAILQLCRQNNILQAARARLMICRGNGTLYTVEDPDPLVIIQADPLPESYLSLNSTGFIVNIYPEVKKSADILANLKSNNYLPYIMAARYAQQHQLHDCLVLNSQGRICDSTIANVFWAQNDRIYTSPLTEGGVAGVMRQYLLNALPKAGYQVQETPCTTTHLEQAGEIFLTNALYGIRWVRQFRNKTYPGQLASQLYDQFVKTL